MLTRCRWLPLAVVALLAGCRDGTAPLPREDAIQVHSTAAAFGELMDSANHILRQASGAPSLETYQVSFWVRRDKLTQVTVNYADGQPFLWFDVPKDGLRAGGGGWLLHKKDSVQITLTIDTTNFVVDFEPSGVVFAQHHPARLVLWYENADPDFNRDGVVDATDAALRDSLHIVTRPVKRADWHPVKGAKGQTLPYVYAELRHFSQWAVSW